MDYLLEDIKKDKDFRKKLTDDYSIVTNSTVKEKDVMLKSIYPKFKLLEEAVNIAGETIYDLQIENDVLKTEMANSNEYDEEKINKLFEVKKSEQDEYKNKIILNAIRKTNNKMKKLV